MGNYKRGHDYWGKKQEDLVLQWVSATTQSEYTRIHNALRPALNFMAELILNRYFSCPFARQNEIKADAVQHCFLLMNKYHPSKVKNTNGAYSFCSMLIKHFYMDTLVGDNQKKNVIFNKIDYFDELPADAKPIDYGQTREIPTEAILSHFKTLLAREKYSLVQQIKICRKSKRPPRIQRFKINISILEKMIEFIERFNSCEPAAMADYVFCNQGEKAIRKTTIANYMRKITGITVVVNMAAKDKVYEVDKRYNYMQDDYTPAESKRVWNKRSNKLKNKDMLKYQYF